MLTATTSMYHIFVPATCVIAAAKRSAHVRNCARPVCNHFDN